MCEPKCENVHHLGAATCLDLALVGQQVRHCSLLTHHDASSCHCKYICHTHRVVLCCAVPVLAAGFADLLGMPAFTLESLLAALLEGSSSPLLGLVHVLLLRQAQADMEISHATGVLQVGHVGC